MDKSKRDAEKLGRSFHQAQRELVRRFTWSLLIKTANDRCYRCGELMDWTSYSLDHAERWRVSEAPLETFFDVQTIVVSHKRCNTSGK